MFVPIDVNFPDDPKVAQLGMPEMGVYVVACCVAKRNKQDGLVARRTLVRHGATDEWIDGLLRVGLLVDPSVSARSPHGVRTDGTDAPGAVLQIAGWLKHNPKVADLVDATKLNHFKWHVHRGVYNPKCKFCVEKPLVDPSVSVSDADTESVSDPSVSDHGYPEMEMEMEIEKVVVSPTGLGGAVSGAATTDDDDTKKSSSPRITTRQLASLAAKARSERLGGPHSPGWLHATTENLLGAHSAELEGFVASGETPERVDLLLDGLDPNETAGHSHKKVDCGTCGNSRWVETPGDNTAYPCPDCTNKKEN